MKRNTGSKGRQPGARSSPVSSASPSVEAALQTPTDLPSSKVKKVVDLLNPIVADAFALYVKTKNFHWHMSGPHFRDFHLLFDEQAEAIFGSLDILAERVRKIGGTTIRSISHISKLQTIEDDNDEFVKPEEMIERLLVDNRKSAEHVRRAISGCEDNDDFPSANLLEEVLDQTERRIWFLSEILRGM